MLTYFLGPILALLPLRWRQGLSSLKINWPHATTISGFVELAAGLAAFWKWYFLTMKIDGACCSPVTVISDTSRIWQGGRSQE